MSELNWIESGWSWRIGCWCLKKPTFGVRTSPLPHTHQCVSLCLLNNCKLSDWGTQFWLHVWSVGPGKPGPGLSNPLAQVWGEYRPRGTSGIIQHKSNSMTGKHDLNSIRFIKDNLLWVWYDTFRWSHSKALHWALVVWSHFCCNNSVLNYHLAWNYLSLNSGRMMDYSCQCV